MTAANESASAETCIREQEKAKRFSTVLAITCFIGGCTVIVFGPTEHEAMSSWVGIALLFVSAGAASYERVWRRPDVLFFGVEGSDTANVGDIDDRDDNGSGDSDGCDSGT